MYNTISSEDVKHIVFCLKSRDMSGISDVGWKHINAFFSVHFSRKCLAIQLLQIMFLGVRVFHNTNDSISSPSNCTIAET